MIRHIINWKKNIKPISWNGLHVHFDNTIPYLDLVKIISELILLHQPIKRVQDLKEGNWIFEENKYSIIHSLEHNSHVNNEISLNENISIAFIKKSRFSTQERIVFQIHAQQLNEEFINKITSLKNLKIAILFNPYFKSWENRKFKDSYFYSGGLIERFNIDLGTKSIDLSNRPGRYSKAEGYNFLGGSDYWISQKLLSKVKIDSIKNIEVENIESNEVNHIKLFDLPSYWSKPSQEKIALLRMLLGIDEYNRS